ncbi:MAG: hypothetical protein IT332_00415 [Ardenticatenales bacterium]|nr:hypothetical protein [Ardenticatenales bacterium]
MSLSTAADVAATFLLLGLFVIHAVIAAVLFGLWRVLRMAERSLSPAMGRATDQLDQLREILQTKTRAAVAPQVDALSAWAGVRAGVASLVRRP